MLLASRGARLLIADIQQVPLLQVAEKIRAMGTECHTLMTDTGNEAAIEALAHEAQLRLGGADVLINNAGVGLISPVARLQTADAHWLMNINFWGVVHGCRYFLPQMQSKPEAVLVNISSIFAMVSMPTQSIYNASKAAVRGFSDALREELRDTSVRVLCVHPGGIKTNIANSARITDSSMVATSDQKMRDNFNKVAHTTAAQAAQAIVSAIESGKTRLLIGADAKFLDTLFRLVPSRSSRWLTNMGQYLSKKAK